MFEAVFVGRFRAQFDSLSDLDREEVQRLIRLIELDPHVDNVHKAELLVAHLIPRVYDNGLWRIVYRVVGDHFVVLFAVTRIWPP